MTPSVWVAFVAAFSIPSNESMNQTMTNKFSSSLTALPWRRSIRINRMNHQWSKPPPVHHGTLQTLSLVGLKQLLHKTGGNVWTAIKKQLLYYLQNTVRRYEIRYMLSVYLQGDCNVTEFKLLHCFILLILLQMMLIHFNDITKNDQRKLFDNPYTKGRGLIQHPLHPSNSLTFHEYAWKMTS